MSDQVEKVGAYLGIAAFLGLAALALLYFAQARELKRLREWAGRAPERAQDLQTRVVAEAEAAARRVRAEPQAKPAAVPGATPGAKPAAAPAAAGAATAAAVTAGAKPGAPAPAAQPATPGAPAPASDGGGPPAAAPVPAKPGAPAPAPAAQPGSPAPAPAAAGAAAAGAVAGAAAVPAKPAEGAKPAETSAAPGAPAEPGEEEAAKEREPAATNGSPPAPVAPATAAARGAARPIPSDDTGEYTVEEDAIQAPPPLPPPRRPAPARAAQPAEAGDGRSTRNTVLAVLAGLLVLAGAAFGATQLLGGEDAPEQPASNEPLPPQNVEPATGGDGGDEAAADPSEIAVHVLNGTTVSGLAAQIADKLKAEGYAAPVTGNNADQQRTQSEVLYADGHRADARALSEVLDVSAVEALDPTTTPAEGADVVVVVGADQAQ